MSRDSHHLFEAETTADYFQGVAIGAMEASLQYSAASIIYGRLLKRIRSHEGFTLPELPEDIEVLVKESVDRFPACDPTMDALGAAWTYAQINSMHSGIRFRRPHKISSNDNLAHFIFLHSFVEVLLNRELAIMRDKGILTERFYSSIDHGDIIAKALFLYKEDVLSNKLKLQELKLIVKYRNAAVHFKGDRSAEIAPTVTEFISIWECVHSLTLRTGSESLAESFATSIDDLKNRWFE